MLSEQQLKSRIWIEETQSELKYIKSKVNGNITSAISLLIKEVTSTKFK